MNYTSFLDTIDKTETCWIWTGKIDKNGYGYFYDRTLLHAHRASWIYHKGEIEKDFSILHHCNTHSCVNPDHLFCLKVNRKMYWIWADMKRRCLCKNHSSYYNYGARGITFCEEWNLYKNFINDMGERPSPKHSLDRIDNSKGYSKQNCKWSTRKEQNNNRRMCLIIEYQGDIYNLKQLWEIHSKPLGITYRALHKRFVKGFPLDICLFTPSMRVYENK